MSSAGRAANSSGCVARPRAREIGLIGFAAQIRRSSLTGSYVMETAEHREPCESRGSRTVLGAPGGEIPPGDSTTSAFGVTSAARPLLPRKRTSEVRQLVARSWPHVRLVLGIFESRHPQRVCD